MPVRFSDSTGLHNQREKRQLTSAKYRKRIGICFSNSTSKGLNLWRNTSNVKFVRTWYSRDRRTRFYHTRGFRSYYDIVRRVFVESIEKYVRRFDSKLFIHNTIRHRTYRTGYA